MTLPLAAKVPVWLATALILSALLTSVVFLGMTVAKGATMTSLTRGLRATAPAQVLRLLEPGGVDSWMPMLAAYQRKVEDPQSDLYEVFFVDRIKFQYPPSSLLILDLLPRPLLTLVDGRLAGALSRLLDVLSRLSVVFTVLASTLILEIGLRRLPSGRAARPPQVAARIGLSLVLGLTFYPLVTGHIVGQIQIYLNVLLALAVICFMIGRPALAGMCFGACCLVKPQYGVILLWSLLRRQWRFALGLAGVLLPGLVLSIARFGLAAHLRYAEVVRLISRLGEAYWPNQSVNGLLNRFLQNGNVVQWSSSQFAPYHPLVYALTVISSVAILGIALWPRQQGRHTGGGLIDLMVLLAAATIASPIAWNHHYGAFLPIFAVVLPVVLYARPLGRATVPLLALSYIAVANLLVWPEVVFRNRWLGLAGSHVLFGSLTFFGLLLALRAGRWDVQESAERP